MSTDIKDISGEAASPVDKADAIPQSDVQLHLIADAIRAVITYVDSEHRCRFVNKTALDWFGRTPSEIIGKHLSEVLGPEAYSMVLPEVETALSGREVSYEKFVPYKDGPRHVQASYVPDKDANGKTRGYFGLIVDISDRVKGEKALQRSEERYKAFIKQSSEGIWRLELDEPIPVELPADEQVRLAFEHGFLAECNDSMARQYGYEWAHEITGARLGELLVEDDPKNREFIKAFIESGYNLSEAESHERDVHGNDRYFLNNFVGFVENGRLVRAWGTRRDITERKRAEQALLLSEERYRVVAETASDAIIRIDEESKILFVNAAAERIFGYKVQEMVGQSLTMLMPEYLRKQHREAIIRYLKTGKRRLTWESIELPAQHADGHIFPVEISFGQYNQEGRSVFIGILRDITARKQNEKANAHLAAIVESSDDAIIGTDLQGIITSWNRGAEKVYGYTTGEVVGKEVRILAPKHRVHDEIKILERIRRGEKVDHYETVRRRKDGTEVDISLTVSPIRDEAGNIIGASEIARNISQQKKANELAERYRLLWMRARDIILFLDVASGRIVEANQAAVTAYGYDHATLLTMNISDLRAPETLQSLQNQYDAADKGGIQFETIHQRSDGSKFPVEVSAIGSDVGGGRLIVSIIRDISERRQAEELLNQNQAMLALAMQSSRMGVWECDLESDVVWWSEELEEIFGLEKGEFEGSDDHFFRLMYEDDRETARAEMASAVNEGRPYTIEFRFRHADGSIRWMEGRGEAVYSQRGRPVRIYGVGIDITPRKKAEEQRRLSDERYRMLFDQTVGGIAETDLEGRFITVNERYCELVGYSRDELLSGMRMQEITDPAYLPDHIEKFRKLVKHGTPFEIEKRYIRKDGSHVWVANSVSAVRDAEGRVQSVAAIAIDVSKRKEAEEKLRESEERYRHLADAMPQLVWTAAPDGTIDYYNSLASRYEGIEYDGEAQTWNWQLTIHPDDRGPTMAAWREAQAAGAYEFEHRMRMKDGSYRWHLSRAAAVKSSVDQSIIKWFGTSTDIHEHKIAQESLVVAERRAADEYRALLARIVPLAQTLGTARDLVSIYRSVLEFVCASMRCTGFFISFYSPVTKLRTAAFAWGEHGEVDISKLPPIELTEDGAPNSRAVFERRPIVVNDFMDQIDGRPRLILQDDGMNPSSCMVVPMIVMNRVIGTVEVQAYENKAFEHDHVVALEMVANLAAVAIENVRLIEIEAKARSEAEAANRMKDEFLSILSHELRTPLNAMLGWIRMLRGGMLDEERSAKALEVIERNTRQQSSLIEDLLDVSRIISGKMKIEKELVDLKTILNEVAESVRPLAMNKEVRFEFQDGGESVYVNGDIVRLQQVVTNLLQNAIKFTSPDGTVAMSLERNGDNAVVRVADNGVGIEPAFLPYIFDRFSQADASAKRNYTGLGLGLTIVRTIVELHGGVISVASKGVDRGSLFTVRLPLAGETAERVIADKTRVIARQDNLISR